MKKNAPITRTFSATQCDACDHQYVQKEKIYLMGFTPDGMREEFPYTLCGPCYAQVDQNPDVLNAAILKIINRAPRILGHIEVEGNA